MDLYKVYALNTQTFSGFSVKLAPVKMNRKVIFYQLELEK